MALVEIDEGELEALRVKASAFDAVVLYPCHVTGEHNPHHTDRYTCREQEASVLRQLLGAAGVSMEDIPHHLHSESCSYCHQVPAEEASRNRQRKLYAWAGIEPSGELVEPGHDVPQPGDPELVLALLTTSDQPWQALLPQLPFRSNHSRFWIAVNALRDQGLAEWVGISVRLRAGESA